MTRFARTGDSLTPRELGILLSLANGETLTEIAAELYLSVQTIKGHTQSLRAKLGATNAAHAVALAYHRGVLIIPR